MFIHLHKDRLDIIKRYNNSTINISNESIFNDPINYGSYIIKFNAVFNLIVLYVSI